MAVRIPRASNRRYRPSVGATPGPGGARLRTPRHPASRVGETAVGGSLGSRLTARYRTRGSGRAPATVVMRQERRLCDALQPWAGALRGARFRAPVDESAPCPTPALGGHADGHRAARYRRDVPGHRAGVRDASDSGAWVALDGRDRRVTGRASSDIASPSPGAPGTALRRRGHRP